MELLEPRKEKSPFFGKWKNVRHRDLKEEGEGRNHPGESPRAVPQHGKRGFLPHREGGMPLASHIPSCWREGGRLVFGKDPTSEEPGRGKKQITGLATSKKKLREMHPTSEKRAKEKSLHGVRKQKKKKARALNSCLKRKWPR